MQLSKAEIKNFRSIADMSISFDPACQVLIGINESGKSNILRALHLLDETVKIDKADLRIERHAEDPVISGYVRFIFTLSDADVREVTKLAKSSFEPESLGIPLLIIDNIGKTLEEICDVRREALYIVPLPSGTRRISGWALKQGTELGAGWFRNKTADIAHLGRPEGTPLVVPAQGFVFAPNGVQPPPAQFERLTTSHLMTILHECLTKVCTPKLPECIFWKYADQYLLPSSIDIASFCANPDSCVPLKSMFELAGYSMSTLLKTITDARAQGHYRYSQILEKASVAATKHVRSVWRDYKTVKIRLEPNGENLSPVIVDEEVPLDMANRSDGFKRFVSFLLQISAKVKTEELQNALILVDEPEIALHPAGARSLMRELIEIGKSNTVVYSTHSIFMVDNEEVGRHLVVEKKAEVTTTWRADVSKIQDEEVLYAAMGYSIFETLKGRNIIFEGWRDKYLFKLVRDAMGKTDGALKERLATIGLTHASGVKDVRHVAGFLELASRPLLIISDADKPALQFKKAYEVPGAWGTWKTLQDIFGAGPIITAEDLIERSVVIKRANKFRSKVQGLGTLTEADFGAADSTIIGLTRWVESAGLAGKPLEEAMHELKTTLFDGLKRADLAAQAETLVKFVDEFDFVAG